MAVRALAIDTEFSKHLRNWSRDVEALRQNLLMSESTFLSFARDLGLSISGVVKGEPSEFHKRGWLSADGRRGGGLSFHPFRLHVLHQALSAECLAPAMAREWNGTADLAIILEPIYWPEITDHIRYGLGESEHWSRTTKYRRKAVNLVRSLDPVVWRGIHEKLRMIAAGLDPNRELYALLRVSSWREREKLRGRISGALWIRHMAEVIRRGFEEIHQTQWAEEDQGFGRLLPGARVRLFGSERPFDDPLRSKPHLAHHFGLFTGSALRWYVEGETEYYAVLYTLREPSRLGIDLVNLKGEIACEKRNAARKLEDSLKEDLTLRRFSVISFDRDVKANERAIRKQGEQDHVVGSINANDPDFEFANFSLAELVDIAALMDKRLGFDERRVRNADWKGVAKGGAFAERYVKASNRGRPLKGKEWGEALAAYAIQHPVNTRTAAARPLSRIVSAAFWAWSSNYNFQKEHFTFDPQTFIAKRR